MFILEINGKDTFLLLYLHSVCFVKVSLLHDSLVRTESRVCWSHSLFHFIQRTGEWREVVGQLRPGTLMQTTDYHLTMYYRIQQPHTTNHVLCTNSNIGSSKLTYIPAKFCCQVESKASNSSAMPFGL